MLHNVSSQFSSKSALRVTAAEKDIYVNMSINHDVFNTCSNDFQCGRTSMRKGLPTIIQRLVARVSATLNLPRYAGLSRSLLTYERHQRPVRDL